MAEKLLQMVKVASWKQITKKDAAHNLASYNEVYIEPIGSLVIPMKSGGWTVNSLPFPIVDSQSANIVGRNTLPKTGIKLHQEKPGQQMVLNIEQKNEVDPDKTQWVREQ